ncbi:MAG: primosomal protein N' [Dehalococcoidia bacterium]|nr:primosomal protein N' [Dehalococcoidia bacterium]
MALPLTHQQPPKNALPGVLFAEVAVDAPLAPGRTLTYSVPSSLTLYDGQTVIVPLGRRRVQGVIFKLHHRAPDVTPRDVEAVVDAVPLLTEAQRHLAQWMSEHYFCSLLQAAALLMPPGFPLHTQALFKLTAKKRATSAEQLTTVEQQVVALLQSGPLDDDAIRLRIERGARPALQHLLREGLVEREDSWPKPRVSQRFEEVLVLSTKATGVAEFGYEMGTERKPRHVALLQTLVTNGSLIASQARKTYGASAVTALRKLGAIGVEGNQVVLKIKPAQVIPLVQQFGVGDRPTLVALLKRLLVEGDIPASQARKEYGAAAVNVLLKRAIAHIERERLIRDPLAGSGFQIESPLLLTAAQSGALEQVLAALAGQGTQRSFVLEGVTGSGKTEVYLQALAQCVAAGKRGMYLVPEIALTPQAVQRLSSRFPGRIALFHSGLSAGEQFDTWWRIRNGEFDVVLGSRSALFTPQPDVALIVIDEEHEWTYKQEDPSPRYHARDVARKLSELTGAVVFMGSATPDVGTYHDALAGEHTLLQLSERLTTGPEGRPASLPLSQVQVVDMRQELKDGNRSIFSRSLHTALGSALQRGEQVILFLNRRGSAGVVQCRDCGYIVRCRRCDLAMTYHSASDRLLCHLCGAKTKPPSQCPECKGVHIRYLGIGTQRVADEVKAAFGAPVLRWDQDTARDRRAHQDIMQRFSNGEAQVLVGTQMVAKGLHLPRVTVVGVVLADVGLHSPDLRSGERLFQVLCQVAGRAGRAELPGRVVIQTYSPEHYAIQAAARQDYAGFYQQEIGYRREHANPPYSRLVRLLYQHVNEAKCQEEVENMGRRITDTLLREGFGEVEVVGPGPAYPSRIRGYYRWQLLLRFPLPLGSEITPFLTRVGISAAWSVDVDPAG